MIKMALIVCASCKAQHDCAQYAVEGMMRAGTWAMGITNLTWLQAQPDSMNILRHARRNNLTVNTYVNERRLS